jgi:phosphate transport system substrate-binding protein
MKRWFVAVLLLLVLGALFSCQKRNTAESGSNEGPAGTISMSGAWALYPMAVKWGEEYQKLHPDVHVDIAAGGAGKGVADALAGIVDIGNVSREIYPEEIEKGAWWVSVVKDAVMPTANKKNPLIGELLSRGLTAESAGKIWITGEISDWKSLLAEGEVAGSRTEIHIYTRSDACGAADIWALYMGARQEDLLGVGVYGDPGLAEAVKKDVLGIGFNNLSYAYDMKTEKQIQGISVIPLDLNGNGRIDDEENFYEDRQMLIRAIASGTYPSPPARELHFVCQKKPKRQVVAAFIRWVLTDGQSYVTEAGYIGLSREKLDEQLLKLGQ